MVATIKLQEFHETAKRIYGDKYKSQVRPFKTLLRRMMKHYETDSAIQAVLEDREATGEDPPLLMIAACYEIASKVTV